MHGPAPGPETPGNAIDEEALMTAQRNEPRASLRGAAIRPDATGETTTDGSAQIVDLPGGKDTGRDDPGNSGETKEHGEHQDTPR